MLYVALKRGVPRKFARFVLFRPVKKRSFNLLRVLDLFSRTLAVNSVSDFLNVKGSLEDCGVKTLQCFSRSSFHRLSPLASVLDHGNDSACLHDVEDEIFNEGAHEYFDD